MYQVKEWGKYRNEVVTEELIRDRRVNSEKTGARNLW